MSLRPNLNTLHEEVQSYLEAEHFVVFRCLTRAGNDAPVVYWDRPPSGSSLTSTPRCNLEPADPPPRRSSPACTARGANVERIDSTAPSNAPEARIEELSTKG